jgi:hypothetical protein
MGSILGMIAAFLSSPGNVKTMETDIDTAITLALTVVPDGKIKSALQAAQVEIRKIEAATP